MITFTDMEAAGLLPTFFSEHDSRSAAEQIDANYQHGGGWKPFKGFTLTQTETWPTLDYPGDPPLEVVAVASLRDELLLLYPYSWLVIFQKSGDWEVARVD